MEKQSSPRASILDQVKLADGRLAWPVASARGMSETAFRGRLNRLTPDQAALGPFEKRGPSRVAERAAQAASFEADRAAARAAAHWPNEIDFAHDDYSGVIWSDGVTRLCVTPRGATYFLQSKASGSWVTWRNFDAASVLRAYVGVVMYDPPEALADAVADLPDDPHDCRKAPLLHH